MFFVDSATPMNNAISLGALANYNPWLVLLSYALVAFGSFMAIAILRALHETRGQARHVGLLLGAIVMATAIWSMHYTGMLAYNMPMKHAYNSWLTLFSGLVALVFALGVFSVLDRPKFGYAHILLSAPLLGIGVACMHYTGMGAMEMDADTYYKPDLFALSIVIAMTASGAALWIMHRVQRLRRYQLLAQLAAALIMGVAVCGMHYTGMMATVFVPYADCRFDYNQSFLTLALVVGGVACVIIGLASSFLLYVRLRQSQQAVDRDFAFLSKLQYASIALTFLLILSTGLLAYRAQLLVGRLEHSATVQEVYSAILFNLHTILFMVLPGITVLIVGVAALLQGRKLLAHAMHERNALKAAEEELARHRDNLQQMVEEQVFVIDSERKALKIAKEAAERANAAKSDFLANMSHELRTPLNSIMGLTQLLNVTHVNADQGDMLDTLTDASKNLLEIVDDILDISKIETGNLELETIPFSPYHCVSRVQGMLVPLASKKGLTLVFHPHDDASNVMLMGDPVRVTRILTNIVGNAVKYTEQGRVDIYLSFHDLADGMKELRVDVVDTGIGIAKEKLDKVFEKFTQADSSTTRKYGGSGLGLAITKQLITLMNGRISVASELGKGSTFSIIIPLLIADNALVNEADDTVATFCGVIPESNVSVLIAEDHELNKSYMRRLLQLFGITNFVIVSDGLAAKEAVATGTFDLVLMDCHMPVMNGYDATRAIREMEKQSGQHIPIIAMTANVMLGEREKCLQMGMDEYISKPIDQVKLREILSRWIRFTTPVKKFAASGIKAQETPRLDLEIMRTFSEGDVEMEKDFVRIFAEQSAIHLATLKEHAIDGTSQGWKDAAHLLKGGAATLGAMKLRLICADAQEMLTATAQERDAMVALINEELTSVCNDLRQMRLLITE